MHKQTGLVVVVDTQLINNATKSSSEFFGPIGFQCELRDAALIKCYRKQLGSYFLVKSITLQSIQPSC